MDESDSKRFNFSISTESVNSHIVALATAEEILFLGETGVVR